MAEVGSVWVSIGAKMRPLERALVRAELRVKRFAERAPAFAGRQFGRVFTGVARQVRRAAIAIAAAITYIEVKALKAGMAQTETANLFSVSMGRMEKGAESWAKKYGAALRLNVTDVKGMLGTFHVMLKSMGLGEEKALKMAKGLTQLAHDMASFYNLPHEMAFQKIQAGISGEVEPLKRLGIILNETTIKNWALTKGIIRQGEKLTEQQKILARYGTLLEMTTDAQGDLARTLGSEANLLRSVGAAWKTFLERLGEASMAGGGFAELLKATRTLVVRLTGDVTELGGTWDGVFRVMARHVVVLDKEIKLFLTSVKLGFLDLEKWIQKHFPFTYGLMRAGVSKEEWPIHAPATWASKRMTRSNLEARQSLLEATGRRLQREIGAIYQDFYGRRAPSAQAPSFGYGGGVQDVRPVRPSRPTAMRPQDVDWARLATSERGKAFWAGKAAEEQMVEEEKKANEYLRQIMENTATGGAVYQ